MRIQAVEGSDVEPSRLSTALTTTPWLAHAQQAGKVYRIVWFSTAVSAAPNREAFFQTLRAHDFLEGRNVVVEPRYTEGRQDRATAQAAERHDGARSRPLTIFA